MSRNGLASHAEKRPGRLTRVGARFKGVLNYLEIRRSRRRICPKFYRTIGLIRESGEISANCERRDAPGGTGTRTRLDLTHHAFLEDRSQKP